MWVVGGWEKRLPVCNGWLLPHTPAALFANSVIDIIVAGPPSTILQAHRLCKIIIVISSTPVLTWLSKLERMQSCWWTDAQCGRVMHTGMHLNHLEMPHLPTAHNSIRSLQHPLRMQHRVQSHHQQHHHHHRHHHHRRRSGFSHAELMGARWRSSKAGVQPKSASSVPWVAILGDFSPNPFVSPPPPLPCPGHSNFVASNFTWKCLSVMQCPLLNANTPDFKYINMPSQQKLIKS